MKVLVIGSGGREHALVWKIRQSSLVKKVYCAPGNAGICELAECVDIAADDIPNLLKFAKENHIDLTVVGPELPLTKGIVDDFEAKNLKIFGPTQAASQLEGSKIFAKEFMRRCNIPTAAFEVFDNAPAANAFLESAEYPLVIKADGLASGKGVIICKKKEEALAAIKDIMEQKVFKEAGDRVVIEQFLKGEEASIMAISDGENYVVFDASQDHKKVFDDDLGPNTGGMGAYCPAPVVTEEIMKKVESRIIEPTIRGMSREGNPFKGVLYAGIMITQDGPMTLEYNVRFGDPETQAVLPRLKNDLIEIMAASCEERLNDVELVWDKRDCVCVVLTSGGYPGKYQNGYPITGLDIAKNDEGVVIFHAGTKKENDQLVTSGGRVLGVTGLDNGIEKAIERTYKTVEKVKFDHCFFRRDIGAKALGNINIVTR